MNADNHKMEKYLQEQNEYILLCNVALLSKSRKDKNSNQTPNLEKKKIHLLCPHHSYRKRQHPNYFLINLCVNNLIYLGPIIFEICFQQ